MFCKKGFPVLAVIVLILSIGWLLNDLGVIAVKIPWLPVVLIVMAIGWIVGKKY